MKEITRRQYICLAFDPDTDVEKLYLLRIENGRPYLRADIECGGERQIPRVEMMRFELDTRLGITHATDKCRSMYSGGIEFMEYDTEEQAWTKAIPDFIGIENNAVFIRCGKSELSQIAQRYPNRNVYIAVVDSNPQEDKFSMPDKNLRDQTLYRIAGKTYAKDECEAVYLFWKAKLEEEDIREDISVVLESVAEKDDKENRYFARWTKAHMEDCVGAVARNRQQDALFQRLLSDSGDGPFSLAAVEGCLRDLFAHSGRKAS